MAMECQGDTREYYKNWYLLFRHIGISSSLLRGKMAARRTLVGHIRYHKAQKVACQKVRRAVIRGELPNLKATTVICVDCKVRRATNYEHRDYGKPLEVDPVCRSCNLKRGEGLIPSSTPKKLENSRRLLRKKAWRLKMKAIYLLKMRRYEEAMSQNGGTMRIAKKLEDKKCALGECGVTFTPLVYWQICCSKEHAKKLRYLRRQHRIKEALEVAEASEGADGVTTGLSGRGVPNGSKGQ